MKLSLTLAGTSVEIDVDDLEGLGPGAERFIPFIAPPGENPMSLAVFRVQGPCFMPSVNGELFMTWHRRDRLLHFESSLEQAYVHTEKRTAEIWVRPGGGIENFLRLFVALECLSTGGLLLHASGVMLRDKAYVCFGQSGSGKSTIAMLAPGEGVMGDDVIAVRREASGLKAYSLPFGHLPGTLNLSAPLAGLFRLRHAPRHSVRELSPARAVAELLSCSPFVHDDLGTELRALETALAFAASAPVLELGFCPDPSVWAFLAGDPTSRDGTDGTRESGAGRPPLALSRDKAWAK